jgi:tagatose-1,6-bisphosphate aldolase
MRLSAISSESHMITILGLDQLLPMSRVLGLSVSDSHGTVKLEQVIFELTRQYSPYLTGVVFSPEIGYRAVTQKSENAGPLFCLERRLIDPDPLTIPLLMNSWNVEAVRQNYGLAKLELFYNPLEAEAETKRQMVIELNDYCKNQGIDFLLELIVYIEATEKEYKNTFQQLQLEAIQDLRTHCSVLALEYPLDALGAVTVTAELDVPWILSARSSRYDDFKENLRTALESGAKGFMATEQFLPEKRTENFDQDECLKFLQTVGKDRVIEVTRIVEETA